MRIFELPIALWPERDLALGILVARTSPLHVGYNVLLGNGQPPSGDITGCVLTLAGSTDDTLAIFVNGIPLKDDNLTAGSDPTEFDLFDLATAAGLTLNTGDLIELFAKDTIVGYWSMFTWSVLLTFDDGSTKTITGGETSVDNASDFAPHYRSMGAFTLGAKPSQFATSYQHLDSFQRHAIRGLLVEEYSAAAPVIDEIGLTVLLSGPDTTLDEYTEFNAHANDLLMLINDELFSVAGVLLVAPKTYRIAVFRARFGTFKQTHSAEVEVYLFSRDELFALAHPAAQPGNGLALKIGLVGAGSSGDASEAEVTGFEVTGQRLAPRISNLAADDQITNAVRAAGSDLEVTWSLPDGLDVPHGWSYQTRLQILVAGVIIHEVIAEGAGTTIPTGTLDPILGGNDCTLRARLEATKDGKTISSEPTELFVEAI